MDSDEGKLFIGGIAWDTTEETLRDHFNLYGEVSQVVIMRDKTTGRPRGFGFVVFSDPSLLDPVLQDKHTIDGRSVMTLSPFSSNSSNFLFCRTKLHWVPLISVFFSFYLWIICVFQTLIAAKIMGQLTNSRLIFYVHTLVDL
jgi:RNA recognition motif-containing protein